MAAPEDRRYSSEIVSIDPLSLVSYAYSKNEIKLNKLEKSDKNAFFISYLQTRDVISATIDISRNIPDSDLKDAIEIKVYDELALDSAIEYVISYKQIQKIQKIDLSMFLSSTQHLSPKHRVFKPKFYL